MKWKIGRIIEKHRQEEKNRKEAKEKIYKARAEAEESLKKLEESDIKIVLCYLMSLNFCVSIKGRKQDEDKSKAL